MLKVIVKETDGRGKGVFATEQIKAGELIFDWTGGPIYEAENAMDLEKDIRDYAIQFEEHKWIDTDGLGRFLNHSCFPNAGVRGLFQIIITRDINPGEEILWDYDMTENSNWVMEECKCGSERCRKLIHGYRFLPNELKKEYQNYISDWLK
ncbi:MAG: SET domain-containing protein-lysine N-methyltransferase [bacterium]|nr:SET domain-containing protein-lysine N-methyltransferase [bacterium]